MAGSNDPIRGGFGALLREFRAAANLTQEELAERSGMSAQAIGALERGVRKAPRPSTVEFLSTALRLEATQKQALIAAARGLAESEESVDRALVRAPDAAGGSRWPDDRSPFPGLRPFDTDLHRAFFGRNEEVDSLADLVRSPAGTADGDLILVIGPSGCGKSSLVRAGLMPVMADEADWLTIPPFFPGHDPLSSLAGELAVSGKHLGMAWSLAQVRERLAASDLAGLAQELLVAASAQQRKRHLLVIIDQLEELLTHTSPEQRSAFARALRPALGRPMVAVATMRPESLPDLLSGQELANVPVRPFTLRPLRRELLPYVIAEPASLAGIGCDLHLLQRLVADTGTGEALPLLAFTLSELAAGVGRGDQLSIEKYNDLGGVHGALRRQADAALRLACMAGGRKPDEVVASLLRLVTVDERGDPTRWRARRDELPETVRAELDVFVSQRLLTTDTDEVGNALVGVAHEAILSAWPPLATAIRAAATGLRARRSLEQAAADWDTSDRPRRGLWEGNQLAAGLNGTGAYLRRTPYRGRWPLPSWWPVGGGEVVSDRIALSTRARGFLRSSIQRDRARRRRLTTVLSVLLGAAVATASIAVAQAREATRQASVATHEERVATARELVAEANVLRETQPRVALLLGVEASRLDPSGDARASLISTLTQSHLVGTLTAQGPISALAFSSPTTARPSRANGQLLVTVSRNGPTILWDVSDRAHAARVATIKGSARAAAFSPDGQTLATGSADGTTLWDLNDHAHPVALTTISGAVQNVVFSADGRSLATGSDTGDSLLWDVMDRLHPTRLASVGSASAGLAGLAFSPDGRTLATPSSGNAVNLWDVSDRSHPVLLAVLGEPYDILFAMAFSPDGQAFLTLLGSGTAVVWSLSDRAHPANLNSIGGLAGPYKARFSSDGRILGILNGDDTPVLWNFTDPAHPVRLPTVSDHAGSIDTIAFSPDGLTFAAATSGGALSLWDLTDRANLLPLGTLNGLTDAVTGAFSPDGHTLVTGGSYGATTLWDLTDPSVPAHLSTLSGNNSGAIAFRSDGRTLISIGVDGLVLWDVSDRAHPFRLHEIPGFRGSRGSAYFSADGYTLAAGNGLWDLADVNHPALLSSYYPSDPFAVVGINSDGRIAVVSDGRNSASVLGLTNHAHSTHLSNLAVETPVLAVNPDGETIATANPDGTAFLWDLSDRRHPARIAALSGLSGDLDAIAFSSDGRIVAIGSESGISMLWDISDRTHPARLTTLSGHSARVRSIAFSPDGQVLYTAGDDHKAVVWDISAATAVAKQAVRLACAIAGPVLSQSDWKRYVPGIPYDRTCP